VQTIIDDHRASPAAAPPARASHSEFGARRLAALCDALGFSARRRAEASDRFGLPLSP